MICNAPYFNAGLHFSTNVQSDDGLLNGFFETPQFKVKLLWRLMKGRKGEPLLNSKTISIESNLIRIESEQDIFCQADGEPVCYDAFRSIEFSILPKALKFIQFS
jgi:diacylglycerol kinase family enzyme